MVLRIRGDRPRDLGRVAMVAPRDLANESLQRRNIILARGFLGPPYFPLAHSGSSSAPPPRLRAVPAPIERGPDPRPPQHHPRRAISVSDVAVALVVFLFTLWAAKKLK